MVSQSFFRTTTDISTLNFYQSKLFTRIYLNNFNSFNSLQNVRDIFLNKIYKICPKFINFIIINEFLNQIYINIDSFNLLNFSYFLKYCPNFNFQILSDICAVDFPVRLLRFSIFYNFLSIVLNLRIFVYFNFLENVSVFSLTSLYNSANWLEREVWDLFGIFFIGHTDLRRILTDYGFDGFALRKDFPLTGYVEVIYDEELKLISYVPLELTQEYRFFDFENPWQIIN